MARRRKGRDVSGVLLVDKPLGPSSNRLLQRVRGIYQGELESLRRFKDDVNEVRMGTECGIGVKNYNDVKPGDKIEVYDTREIARTL